MTKGLGGVQCIHDADRAPEHRPVMNVVPTLVAALAAAAMRHVEA